MAEGVIEVGKRVWVLDMEVNAHKSGVIVSLPPPESFFAGAGFVVLLDGEKKVVTCRNDRRGVQWDFAD